jgi:hypothetical protein
LGNKSIDNPINKRIFFCACFLIFSKKNQKTGAKHHFISPPEAAKYFLHNPGVDMAWPIPTITARPS